MKKYLFAIFALTIALGVFAQVLPTLASGVYLPVQGGTGTSSTPQSGEFLIGNGNGTYTAAYIVCTGNCSTATSSGGFTINVTGSGGGSSTVLYAGPYIMLNASGSNGYVVSNIGVLSLASSSDIGVSNATGTGISFSFLNPKGFTTTTIQSVLNSLSAIGLATYNTLTGQFSVSSSSLNLGTASHYSFSDFLPSSTVYVSTVNGQSGAITITSSSLGVLLGVQTTTPYSAGYIPVASTSLALSNSIISQSGTLIGINTSTPFAPLDVVNPTGSTILRLTDHLGNSIGLGTQSFTNTISALGGSTLTSAAKLQAAGLFLGNSYEESPAIGHIDTTSGTDLDENARGQASINLEIASKTVENVSSTGITVYGNATTTNETVSSTLAYYEVNASGTVNYQTYVDSSGFLHYLCNGTIPGTSPIPYCLYEFDSPTLGSSASSGEVTFSQSLPFNDGSRTFTDWTTEQYPPTFLTGFFETATGSSGSSSQLYPFGLTFTPQGGGHHTVFQVTPVNATGTWNGATFALTGNTTVNGTMSEGSTTITGAASTTGNLAVGASETIASGLTIAGGGANITGNITATGTENLYSTANGAMNTFRGSTSNYDTQCVGTGSTAWWCEQLNPNGTNNLQIVDSQDGGAALTANINGSTTIGNSGTGVGITAASAFTASTTATINQTTTLPSVATNSILLTDGSHNVIAYGGTSCPGGQVPNSESASGTFTGCLTPTGGSGGIASSSPFSSPFISLITASGTLTNSTLSESTSTGNLTASGTVTAIYTKDGLTYTSFRIFPTAAIGLTNFYTGSLGCEFTVSQEITVSALGRFYNGSSTNNHTEYIWNESNNGLAVTSGTILAASASDSNGNKFVNLTSTVILYPFQTYDMSIDETSGGDYWINNGTQSWNNVDYFQPVINRTAATYAPTASGAVNPISGQTCYDAPMFKYTLEANPQVNVEYNASNTGGITMTPEGNLTISARTADESVGIVSPLAVGRGTGQAGYSLTVAGNSLVQGAQPLMVGDAGSTYGVPGNYVIFSTAGSAQSYDTIEYSAAGLFLSGNPNLYLNWTSAGNSPTVTSYGSFTITNENASNPTLTLNPDGGEPLLQANGTIFTPQIRSDGSIVAGDQNASADAPLEVYSSRQGAPSLTSSSTDLFAVRSTISTALTVGNNNSSPYSTWIQTKRTSNDGSSWQLNLNPLGGPVSVNENNISNNAQFSVGGTIQSGVSGSAGCAEYYDHVTSTQLDYAYPSIALGYVVATTTKPAWCQ